jgi:hypothetical protein
VNVFALNLCEFTRGDSGFAAILVTRQGLKSGEILDEPGQTPANIRDAITSGHR